MMCPSELPGGVDTGAELFPRRCSEQFIRNQERERHIISKAFAVCFFQKRGSICCFLKGKEAASRELWLAVATAEGWAPRQALAGPHPVKVPQGLPGQSRVGCTSSQSPSQARPPKSTVSDVMVSA